MQHLLIIPTIIICCLIFIAVYLICLIWTFNRRDSEDYAMDAAFGMIFIIKKVFGRAEKWFTKLMIS